MVDAREAAPVLDPGLMGPALALAHREIVRFLRQKGRVIGAVATPLFVWAFLGLGIGKNFAAKGAGGADYLAYFFPGMIAMLVLFTAIFSAISVIQDRNEGFLQGVLAAPVDRMSIVLGKVLGGTAIATGQAALVLLLAPLAGIPLSVPSFVLALAFVVMMAVAMAALGFFFAWGTDSVQSFHAVMNLVLFPLWVLSGAFFPPEGWLGLVMRVNPLTHGLAALRRALYSRTALTFPDSLPSMETGGLVMAVFAAVMLGLCAWRVTRSQE